MTPSSQPMHITMVKKLLANGQPCNKCVQAEELLKARGLWSRIHDVVWAIEGDATSRGMQLAEQHQVDVAPFFLVQDTAKPVQVIKKTLDLLRLLNESAPASASASANRGPFSPEQLQQAVERLSQADPPAIIRAALEHYGADCAIAFSGAEDVVAIDMAVQTGLPFSVFSLDTGRLHPETYRFIDRVRAHYGIEIDVMFPAPDRVQALVKQKGLFSFYQDGHSECCGIRKVEPLGRALKKYRAWITGQRRDQSPTRAEVPVLALDTMHEGASGAPVKFNPLARWSLQQTWDYIREHQVPFNALHERGFISIGCEPCTRAIQPGEHERAGRWYWEETTHRECGLHVVKP